MTTSPTARPSIARGPTRRSERTLAPDLARGAMLLGIALVNGPELVPARAASGASLALVERIADAALSLVVHARAYPVFAIMFGYGIVQLARRQSAAGATRADVRRVLLRRNAWLVAFGTVHAALLYFGDFLAAYGIIGIVATLAVLHRDRVQRILLWLWVVSIVEMVVLGGIVVAGIARGAGPSAALTPELPAAAMAASYAASIPARLHAWPAHTLTVLPAIFIVGLGMWAAERRLLEDAARHRRTLWRVAVVGLGIAVLGGLPLALVQTGTLHGSARTLDMITMLHRASGMFAGPGYVALFGLLAQRLAERRASPRSGVVGWLAALGQRSLSGYLFQSLAWQLLLSAYALALPSRFLSPRLASIVIAILVWAVSVGGAAMLERRRRAGPAEALLRLLAYRGRSRAGGRVDPRPARVA